MKDFIAKLAGLALKKILEVEAAIPGASGAEKKAYVARLLDEAVKLPWYLEYFDGALFSLVIDVLCYALNDRFGHKWQRLLAVEEEK